MICAPCKRAGMHNQDAVALGDYGGEDMAEHAKALHVLCEQPLTCPCHHMTGDYIRTEVHRDHRVIR